MINSFSIPFNYKLSNQDIQNFLFFLNNYNDLIFDIYVGVNIKPFLIDAMNLNSFDENKFDFVLKICEEFNIPISLTFNNICVSPSYKNYNIFVNELKFFLKKYIKRKIKWHFTIPFTLWLKFGFKNDIENFLNDSVLIKNTILWNLNDPSKIAKQFEEGFDYINIDRNLMRNVDILSEIKNMKQIMEKKLNKKLYISLLANESCEGNCSIQNDHFIYNLNENKEKFFENKQIRVESCYYKDKINPRLYLLKSANLIPEKEEFEYYKKYIDVFKMHGRENIFVFNQTIDLIKNINNDDKKLAYKYIEMFDDITEYNKFKKVIKNCKFYCYKCNFCDEIVENFEFKKNKNEIKLF
jgi:hypothetical protein